MKLIKSQAQYSPRLKLIYAAYFGPFNERLNAEETIPEEEVKVTWEKQFILYQFLCWPHGSSRVRVCR